MLRFKEHRLYLQPVPFHWPINDSPLNAVFAELVRELGRAGWDVPNIDVDVRTYGAGTDLHRTVSNISGSIDGDLFRFHFGNRQNQCDSGAHNICTGISTMNIPRIEYTIYSDDSGPTLYYYVGNNWARDAETFMTSLKVNSKLNGEEKSYLKFCGEYTDSAGYIVKDRGSLHPDRDLDREYEPTGNEPRKLNRRSVVADIIAVAERVVAYVKALPSVTGHDDITIEGDANFRRRAHIEPIEVLPGFPPLHTMVDTSGFLHLFVRHHPDRFPTHYAPRPCEDYGLPGNGWRLCHLGLSNPKGEPFPEEAYHGYNFAWTGAVDDKSWFDRGGSFSGRFPVIVKLKYANHIFVIDEAALNRSRDTMFEEVIKPAGRDRFTDAEVGQHYAAVARTMVAIADYKGDYEKPVYLIGRQLGYDEVRPVEGPIRVVRDETNMSVIIDDPEGPVTVFKHAHCKYAEEQVVRIERDYRYYYEGQDEAA